MFDNIIGNNHIKTSLQNSIKFNKVAHSYIISGESKSGKKLIAYTFAKTLQCYENGINPCNNCKSCISFDSENHPDVIYVKAKANTIGLEKIKDEILSKVYIKPYSSKYKIFIIHDANKLTLQAQNTLLKTIEEPHEYSIFIFMSENYNSLVNTILSRCIVYKIRQIDALTINTYLKDKYTFDEEYINFISSYSNGNIGRAIQICEDEKFIKLKDFFSSIPFKIIKNETVKVFSIYKEIETFKDDIYSGLDIIYIVYRDILVYKETHNPLLIMNKTILNDIEEYCSYVSSKSILFKLDSILYYKTKLKQNSNFQLTIELLLFKLKEE